MTTKTARLISIVLLAGSAIPASAQSQLWIRQIGTNGDDGRPVLAVDGAGGFFMAGWTMGDLGGVNAGGEDVWLARYDSEGNQLWIRQIGTAADDEARAVAPDGAGGLYVAGATSGGLASSNAGGQDAWVAHYDAQGSQTWIRQLGAAGDESVNALASDGAGGVFVGGTTTGSLGAPNAGSEDAFLARFDALGNQIWIRQFGSSGGDSLGTAAADGTGGVFVGGWTTGSIAANGYQGHYDGWAARYDAAGNQTWIQQIGTYDNDQANAVAADGVGGVFVAGNTSGALVGTNAGLGDAWLARYDGAGTRTWLRQFGTAGNDIAITAAPDGIGGAFVGGWSTGGLGGTNPDPSTNDAWLARYDVAGSQTWIRRFGTTANDEAWSLAPDRAGGVFVGGFTAGSLGGTNAGDQDPWVAHVGTQCYANCDGSTAPPVLNVNDFACFLNKFAAGCP